MVDRTAEIARGLRVSPRIWWGDEGPSEAYLLDLLEQDWKYWVRGEFDEDPDGLARAMRPELWSWYIEESQQDPQTWKLLQAALRHLRAVGAVDGMSVLIRWAVDVAAGNLQEPRPKGRPPETIRNALIVAAVRDIHDLCKQPDGKSRPYESKKDAQAQKDQSLDEPVSACAVVAKRLHLDYEAVRKVWHARKEKKPT